MNINIDRLLLSDVFNNGAKDKIPEMLVFHECKMSPHKKLLKEAHSIRRHFHVDFSENWVPWPSVRTSSWSLGPENVSRQNLLPKKFSNVQLAIFWTPYWLPTLRKSLSTKKTTCLKSISTRYTKWTSLPQKFQCYQNQMSLWLINLQ